MEKFELKICQECSRILPVNRTLLERLLNKPTNEPEQCKGPVKLVSGDIISYGPGHTQSYIVRKPVCRKDVTPELLAKSVEAEKRFENAQAAAGEESKRQ